MKLNSPAVRFGLSIFAALVVGASTWRTLARAKSEQGVGGPAARVLVLRKAIMAGHAVAAGDVEARFLPAAFAEPGAFRDVKDVTGARTRIGLMKGEQLTRSKVESESARLGLAWSLPPGQTALTLRLPADGAVGGHLLPGDWVSVLSCPSRGTAVEIARRLRVGAVGDKVWDPAGIPGSPAAGLGSNEFFLVTLIVTFDQAARLVSAVERGRLTMTLMSPLNEAAGRRANDAR